MFHATCIKNLHGTCGNPNDSASAMCPGKPCCPVHLCVKKRLLPSVPGLSPLLLLVCVRRLKYCLWFKCMSKMAVVVLMLLLPSSPMQIERSMNLVIPKDITRLRVRARDPYFNSSWSKWTPWKKVMQCFQWLAPHRVRVCAHRDRQLCVSAVTTVITILTAQESLHYPLVLCLVVCMCSSTRLSLKIHPSITGTEQFSTVCFIFTDKGVELHLFMRFGKDV